MFHKYIKKILGKNGTFRYIYKTQSERQFDKNYKKQKEAQKNYNSSLKKYQYYNNKLNSVNKEIEKINKERDTVTKVFMNTAKTGKEYEHQKAWNKIEDLSARLETLLNEKYENSAKTSKYKNETVYYSNLVKTYYGAGIDARKSYLDFSKDVDTIVKQTKAKSFLSSLFKKKK